jgi:aryl-alcohol dehydrogenase-like predicted oxidoreductase
LAWLLHQGEDIFPIPGTRRVQRVEENAMAMSIQLNAEVLQRIDALIASTQAIGSTLV